MGGWGEFTRSVNAGTSKMARAAGGNKQTIIEVRPPARVRGPTGAGAATTGRRLCRRGVAPPTSAACCPSPRRWGTWACPCWAPGSSCAGEQGQPVRGAGAVRAGV